MRFHEIVPVFNLLVGRRLDIALFGSYRQMPDGLAVPRTFLLHGEELAQIRERWKVRDEPIASAADRFLRHADQLLPLPLLSVREKRDAPADGEAGDYVSLARYWWPNPATEDGLPYVLRDGQTNPSVYSDEFDLSRLEEFSYRSFVLAFAFALTEDEVYARRCVELIEHWCLAPDTRQSPHFEHAQIRPGRRRGGGVGIIEAHRLIYVVEAAQMIAGSAEWPEAKEVALKGWFSALLTWLRTSKTGLSAAQRTNNIGVWYDVQCAVYALYTGDSELAAGIVQDSGLRRLDTQMGSDGTFPAELARTRPYDYFAFNLLAYMALARVGESVDVDLWTRQLPDGRSLESAVQWLRNIVQPETLAFHAGLRAATPPVIEPRDAEMSESPSQKALIAALAAEVDALRWKIRAAAAERGELVAQLKERGERAERLLALVAFFGAAEGNGRIAGLDTAELNAEKQGEGMEDHKRDRGDTEPDVTELCVEIGKLQIELEQERIDRKNDSAALRELERDLRAQTGRADQAEKERAAALDAVEQAVDARARAEATQESLQAAQKKAVRKIAAIEDAISRMVRARAENEGRIRDRYDYLLQEQDAKAEKKLATMQAKRREANAAAAGALAREEAAQIALVNLENSHAHEREEAGRQLRKLELKEKRKRRAVELNERQALAALQRVMAEREQLATESARLRAEVGRLSRPLIARAKGRFAGNAQETQKHKAAAAIEESGILNSLKSFGHVNAGTSTLLESSTEQLKAFIPVFSADWYVARYPDVLSEWNNPLAEHLAEGGRLGRRPHPLFWSAWYAKRYLSGQSDICPLVHFLGNASKQDLDPNPYFDSSWYRKTYLVKPRVKAVPLLHYISEGREAGFQTSPRIDLALVRQQYPEARMPGGDALEVLLELPREEREKYKRATRVGGHGE